MILISVCNASIEPIKYILLTQVADPVLKQVPLIKNPSFQPPKPVTLNTNYTKLLPSLSNTVKPPKLSLTKQDLQHWVESIEQLKPSYDNSSDINVSLIKQYQAWLDLARLKVAPGFNSSIMTPQKKPESNQASEQNDDTNELDKIFGKTKLLD